MPSRLGLGARSKTSPAGRGSRLRDLRATVQIVPWGEGDLPLLERLNGDPAMMEHLGGAERREQLVERQARYLAVSGTDRMPRIVDGATGEAAGWVGYAVAPCSAGAAGISGA